MISFLPLVLSLLLPSLITAAKSTASNDSATKLAKYKALAKKNNGIITLNSESYDDLTDGPRDFSISIVLTAMASQYNCAPCLAFAPEHALVAKQWSGQSESDMHLFAVLDFADGGSIYKRFGLNSAPKVHLYLPNEGSRASKSVGPEDGGRGGYTAEGFSNHIRSAADIPLRFSRPIDKMKALLSGLTLSGSILIAVFAWPFVRAFLSNKYLWAMASIFTILLMTSGYMWNQIRHPQYSSKGGDGKMSYVAGGYSNQYGAETHILATVYGLLAFSAYTLAFTIPKIGDPMRQRLGVYVWTGISVLMLGFLTSLFTTKQGAYPFRFLF